MLFEKGDIVRFVKDAQWLEWHINHTNGEPFTVIADVCRDQEFVRLVGVTTLVSSKFLRRDEMLTAATRAVST